jgi:D-glycero-D-manno-heptose 1,7-bisphosphate phosphatase
VKQAVFLDKDGTLIEDIPYNVDPDKIRLVPGAGGALRAMQHAGYELIVITNQSGVARGYFREQALEDVDARLRQLLSREGVLLAGFYYCPHHPDGSVSRYAVNCWCRKPAPGLLYSAAIDKKIHLGSSWFVGDILNDVEAGRRAGCRTILVDNGGETEWELSTLRRPHYVVDNLVSAADVIVGIRRGAEVQEVAQRDLVARAYARVAPGGAAAGPRPPWAVEAADPAGERA